MGTHKHNLVDADGHVVSTVQHRDRIEGIMMGDAADARRLSDVSIGDHVEGVYQMPASFYSQFHDAYAGGKVDWIADFMDGSVRTVQVRGADAKGAWGTCGGCTEDLLWQLKCPINATDNCTIVTHLANPYASSSSDAGARRTKAIQEQPTSLGDLMRDFSNETKEKVLDFLQ